MEFYRHLKPARQPAFLRKFMRDVESGNFEFPKCVDVLSRYRTEELKLVHHAPLKVVYPEDELIRDLHKRYPQIKNLPISLNSFKATLSRQFTTRQLELIQTAGLSREQAFAQAEQEFQPQLQELNKPHLSASAYLQLVQQEEEGALKNALKSLIGNRPGLQKQLDGQ